MNATTTDHAEKIGRAGTRLAHADRTVKTIRKRAGRALKNYDQVNEDLNTACDVFADGNWGDLTVEEIAQAGEKIGRLGRQLLAAGQIAAALDERELALNALRKAQNDEASQD